MTKFSRIALILLGILLGSAELFAHEPLPENGVKTRSSDYFEQRYQYNDLVHYLDNLDLYVTYQAETTGEFNKPDRLIFSIEGNSFRWNSYYLDGFRLDSRFFSGSTLYTPDLFNSSLSLDYIGSELHFHQNAVRKESIAASFNVGGLGGISASTKRLINLFHETASERAYQPIEFRNKVAGAATLSSTFATSRNGKSYYHSQLINFGQRDIVSFGNKGIDSYYPERYLSAQFSGDLVGRLGGLFDSMHYIANISTRSALNAEFYYDELETAAYAGYSASLYGVAARGGLNYTSGVTFAQHNTAHEDINFRRNLFDQDGEGFEPFAPDGNSFELSHSLTLSTKLNDWLTLSYDGFNSLLYAAPTTSEFSNIIFTQEATEDLPTNLYLYKWRAESYASGLLENTLSLSTAQILSPTLLFRANADITLDAMLLGGGKSKVSPNAQLQANLSYNPARWFSAELTIARRRIAYTIEDLQFFSDDYLNGEIYYTEGSSTSGTEYFTSTGGALHSLSSSAEQPAYWALDIPLNFTFGRHRISLLQSARKYVNSWITSYDSAASDYGHFVADSRAGADIFFLNSGATPSFVVDNYPAGIMGDAWLTSSPFYFSSNVQYSYTAPKFCFSFAWQSYMQSGISALGNGALHNNLGILSESTANPNTMLNTSNLESPYMAIGRLDQERAYVIRMFAAYNITERFNVALNFKFKDGQPFSVFDHTTTTDAAGNRQVAIYPSTTRGINTFDGEFGTRKDAFFNLDLRASYRMKLGSKECELQLGLYNLYDFGTELTEYTFDQDLDRTRHAMSLNIPRGVIFSFKYLL